MICPISRTQEINGQAPGQTFKALTINVFKVIQIENNYYYYMTRFISSLQINFHKVTASNSIYIV
jgi:hypothetical protein